MKIRNLLTLMEAWLFEIEADQVGEEHFDLVPTFLSRLASELDVTESWSAEKLSSTKLLGMLQALRNPTLAKAASGYDTKLDPAKVDMTPGQHVGGGREQQRLAYGFADKQDRDIKVTDRELELATAIADSLAVMRIFDTQNGKILDIDKLSFIRDFISNSGERNPFSLLNRPNFTRAKRAFQEKKVDRVTAPSEADKITKNMDMNTFIFALSVANARNRGKRAWTHYVDPDIIEKAKSTFEVRTDVQDAAENLLHMGFLEKEGGKLLPNWDNINNFKENVNNKIGAIIDRGAKLRHTDGRLDRPGAEGRLEQREEDYKNLQKMIEKYIPNELYSSAKRRAVSKIKDAFSAEGIYPELKNAITKYLQDFEASHEFSPPSSGLSGYIQRSTEIIAMKMVLASLNNLLKASNKPVNLNRDLTALKMNVSKYMRRRASA